MDFQKTGTGRRLFANQLSQMIELLQIISEKLSQQLPEKDLTAPEMKKKDILSDLYYGRHLPESFEREKEDPHNREVKQAMEALLHTLSPEQRKLFDAYEFAENARGGQHRPESLPRRGAVRREGDSFQCVNNSYMLPFLPIYSPIFV